MASPADVVEVRSAGCVFYFHLTGIFRANRQVRLVCLPVSTNHQSPQKAPSNPGGDTAGDGE